MKLKTILTIALVFVIIVLGCFLVSGIMHPVNFTNDYDTRSTQVINKLKDIRAIQEAYRSKYGRYCGDMDSLITFAETDKVPFIQRTGTIPDGKTEAQALKDGDLKKDTSYVSVVEKLYSSIIYQEKKGTANPLGLYISKDKIKDLKYIPFSDNKEVFKLQARMLDRGGVSVPVFEAIAPILTYTNGMDKQDIVNKIADLESKNRYAGWKVGDLTQPIIDGNFE
jgi:CRISPR/Cas system CMR-associated protein Cmr5 small subunit